MEWIKRNLLFVAGSATAVVLMGLASYYLVSGSRKNDAALEQLNAEYALLKRLNEQNPHPGDEKTDNVSAARKQRSDVVGTFNKVATVYQPVPSIPNNPRLDNAMFAGALRKTIDQMQMEAAKGGVRLPTNFYFSFTAVRDRIMFDQAGLKPLSAQLGEVKAICDVLIAARVNALDSVRREKVSVHDADAQQSTDYLAETSTTNQIAILAPYEVSFRCFSSELAAVLSGYASSPHGFIVRAMNVEPATMAGSTMIGVDAGGFQPYAPGFQPPTAGLPVSPWAVNAQPPVQAPAAAPLGGVNPYAAPRAGGGVSPFATPGAATPGRVVAPGRGGLPTLLDETQLKVTMLVQVVKLASRK